MKNKTWLARIAQMLLVFQAIPSSYANYESAYCELYNGPGYYLSINNVSKPGSSKLVADVTDSRGNLVGRYLSVQALPPITVGSEVTYTYQSTTANGQSDFTLKGTFKNGIATAYSIKGIYNEGRGKGKPIITDLSCNTFFGKLTTK